VLTFLLLRQLCMAGAASTTPSLLGSHTLTLTFSQSCCYSRRMVERNGVIQTLSSKLLESCAGRLWCSCCSCCYTASVICCCCSHYMPPLYLYIYGRSYSCTADPAAAAPTPTGTNRELLHLHHNLLQPGCLAGHASQLLYKACHCC